MSPGQGPERPGALPKASVLDADNQCRPSFYLQRASFPSQRSKTQPPPGDDGARFARMPYGPLGRFSVYVPGLKEMLLVSAAWAISRITFSGDSVEPRLSRSPVRRAALPAFARTLEKPGTLLEGRGAEYRKIGSGP